MKRCDCGWIPSYGIHLCHRCRKQPGKYRLYVPPDPEDHLSGVTLVYKPRETWNCDACWAWFLEELAKSWEARKQGPKTEVQPKVPKN